ncbi:MAG: putative DNA binding domain-containing protein [Leptonema sp. (in: Bacteria)]|nr:putative DNA binding domain-containing protein [Leptonema sp. (in: bacteria)]
MKSLSDNYIKQILNDLESDQVERKESFRGSAPTTVREAVCAFANNLAGHSQPGVVIIGVYDNGQPVSGFIVNDELLRNLADIKVDGNIVPPPEIIVEKRNIDKVTVAVVTVWPCDTPPVRYKGRIHVRWGPRRGLATAQDERILNERRRHQDRPFDIQPLRDAKITDLERLKFELEYLPALVAPDVLEQNDRSYEQKLAATKMIMADADPTPTVLGMLIIGKSTSRWIAGAYSQFLRIAGFDLTAPIVDEAVIQGTVPEQIKRLEEKIMAHNLRSVKFQDVAIEVRKDLYPLEACQQLLRNAFLHRSYEATNAPVRLYWFDDRIEIHNPGGPFGSVSVENFGNVGLTDYRNPNLAESLRALGFIQRFGAGIVLAKKQLGNRLSFKVTTTTVTVVIAG